MESLIGTLTHGILASNHQIPQYLSLLQEEYSARDVRETHFSMYCFWSGEKNLGNLDGVIATKAGFMNGTEVVKIKYDADRLKENDLISYASHTNCADAVYSNDQREINAANKLKVKTQSEGKFRPDNQPKYYTFISDYKYLPMTHLQALKVNTALSNGILPNDYLSPRQLELLSLLKTGKVKKELAIDQDFALMWNKLILHN
jgi:copper chaperone CopZ